MCFGKRLETASLRCPCCSLTFFVLLCVFTASWEIRDTEVPLSMSARRVRLGSFSVAGMVRVISAPLMLMEGVRIMRGSLY